MINATYMPPMPSNDAMAAIYHLLDVIANAEKYKAKLDELAQARDVAREAIGQLTDLQAKHAAVAAEREIVSQMATLGKQRLEDALNAIAADRVRLQAEQDAHALSVKAHTAKRGKFDELVAAHSTKLAELDRLRKVLA